MQGLLPHAARLALDFLFPFQCLGCGREGKVFCPDCEVRLPRLTAPYCPICSRPNSVGLCHGCRTTPLCLEGIRAPYTMEGPVRESVHQLKYHQVRAAAPVLGRLMAQHFLSSPLPIDFLVATPLHKRRLRQRGYNQSILLAREVGKQVGLPVWEELLIRTRDSAPQVRLSRAERARNVEGSFECTRSVEGASILMIDDVATTGSTMSACGEALKRYGARSVWGLVLAREG